MERYIEKNGKKMRYGFTTGTCAAAAAKAATLALYKNELVDYMTINTPKGWQLAIEIEHVDQYLDSATCCVVKDAGDDPDVTDGIRVFATVMKSPVSGIAIEGGIGVGRVTRKGLRVQVGEAAINPVPLEMIRQEVLEVLPYGEGLTVIIYVPDGLLVSKKTFNSKLGIIGGISILGTSGIVEPMSEDAFSDSLKAELSVKVAEGMTDMIYVFGNFGRDYLGADYSENQMMKTSNFVAYMMKAAASLGIKRLIYVGHAGKMVKVAAGMGNTHSKYGDGRMQSILERAKECWEKSGEAPWLDQETEKALLGANTSDEAVELLQGIGRDQEVFDQVAYKCKEVLEAMAEGKVEVECLVFTTIYGQIGETQDAIKLLEALKR